MTLYEVTCIEIFEEEASSADEAKEIVEKNLPEKFMYMIAKKVWKNGNRSK